MPIPQKYLADFTENSIFHIYNRTNNNEPLFRSDENRYFFLQKYSQYTLPFLDTYCWCLLPDHFHLLTQIKSAKDIEKHLLSIEPDNQTRIQKKFLCMQATLSELIEQTFRQFFQSYALSFNKMYNRKGNLFYKPFKRMEIIKESQFSKAVVYTHANPLKHGLVRDFSIYKWSSWNSILNPAPTKLLRTELLDWFGGKNAFIETHQQMKDYYYESDISIEK